MDFSPITAQVWGTLGWFIPLMLPAFFKVVVASTVFSGRLLQRLLFLFPLGVECHRPDGCPVACGT